MAGSHRPGVFEPLPVALTVRGHMASRRPVRPSDEPDELTELNRTSWLGVLKRSIKEFNNDNLSDWAAALTYRGVLTLAPSLLIVVSILGLLGKSTTDKLLTNIGQLTPGGVQSVLQQIVDSVQQRGSAGLAAVIGLALALWSASSYVAAFMRASNAIYGMGEGRPVWKTLPVRIGVTLVLVVMGLLAAVIVVFSGPLADKTGHALGMGSTALTVWSIAKWPVLIVIVSLMLAILYYAATNVKQPGVQWISPGGVIAVLIWLVVSGAFAVYVANFGSYNKTYGTLGGLIALLVWFWITNLAILFGHQMNAERERSAEISEGRPRAEKEIQLEPRDEPKDQKTT